MKIKDMYEYISYKEREYNHKITSFEKTYIVTSVLDRKNTHLLLDANEDITTKEEEFFKSAVYKRLIKKSPVEKIFNTANFFGYDLYINEYVLSPRNETELLVERIFEYFKDKKGNYKILDMCTGSGCIAIALAGEYKNATIYASDISKMAIKVAKKNVQKQNFEDRIEIVESDLFDKVKEMKYDLIVSNPPYVKSHDLNILSKEVFEYDPHIALDGGEEGVDFYQRIICDSIPFIKNKGYIFFEVDNNTSKSVLELMKDKFEKIKIYKDYNNIDRIICGQRKR